MNLPNCNLLMAHSRMYEGYMSLTVYHLWLSLNQTVPPNSIMYYPHQIFFFLNFVLSRFGSACRSSTSPTIFNLSSAPFSTIVVIFTIVSLPLRHASPDPTCHFAKPCTTAMSPCTAPPLPPLQTNVSVAAIRSTPAVIERNLRPSPPKQDSLSFPPSNLVASHCQIQQWLRHRFAKPRATSILPTRSGLL